MHTAIGNNTTYKVGTVPKRGILLIFFKNKAMFYVFFSIIYLVSVAASPLKSLSKTGYITNTIPKAEYKQMQIMERKAMILKK